MSNDKVNCCCPLSLHTEIEINAPVDTVWQVFMDGKGHDSWDCLMTNASWTINTKSGDNVSFVGPDGPDTDSQSGICKIHDNNANKKEFQIYTPFINCLCCVGVAGQPHFIATKLNNNDNITRFERKETFHGCIPNICCCLLYCCRIKPMSLPRAQNGNKVFKEKVESIKD